VTLLINWRIYLAMVASSVSDSSSLLLERWSSPSKTLTYHILHAIFTFFAVKYNETASATIAGILISKPCSGSKANAPPSPKIPSNGIVQTGQPDARA